MFNRKNKYDEGFAEGYDKGFQEAQDRDKERIQEQIERKAVSIISDKGYPNPLHVFDISSSGIVYLNQEPMGKEKAKELKSEATLLKGMTLWEVLQETLREEAIKKAILFSKNWEDTLAGKMMLENLRIIKFIVDKIASIDTDKLPSNGGGPDKML